MAGFISDSPLARELIRIGDVAIAREDDAALQAPTSRRITSSTDPVMTSASTSSRAYFAPLRSAFSGLRVAREQIIANGNFLAARTTFSGDFTAVFTHSPIGPVEPTGHHLEWELIGAFRYDNDGPASRGVGAD